MSEPEMLREEYLRLARLKYLPDNVDKLLDQAYELVERRFRVTRNEITGQDRRALVCRTRALIEYFLRALLGCRLAQVGNYVNRDHTAVLRGVRSVEHLAELAEPSLRSVIAELEEIVDREVERIAAELGERNRHE